MYVFVFACMHLYRIRTGSSIILDDVFCLLVYVTLFLAYYLFLPIHHFLATLFSSISTSLSSQFLILANEKTDLMGVRRNIVLREYLKEIVVLIYLQVMRMFKSGTIQIVLNRTFFLLIIIYSNHQFEVYFFISSNNFLFIFEEIKEIKVLQSFFKLFYVNCILFSLFIFYLTSLFYCFIFFFFPLFLSVCFSR